MPFEYHRTAEGHYQCPYCEYSKELQSTVHMHIKAKHAGAYKHKCEHCAYETSTNQNLENHIISKHPEKLEKPALQVTCPCCKTYECRTKGQLRSHYLLNHLSKELHAILDITESSWNCKCCQASFKSKAAFTYHSVKCLSNEVKDSHKDGLCL